MVGRKLTLKAYRLHQTTIWLRSIRARNAEVTRNDQGHRPDVLAVSSTIWTNAIGIRFGSDMDGGGQPDPLIAEFSGSPGRSIDLGCGLGENVLALARVGWDANGVDNSSVAVERATAIARDRQLSARFVVADLTSGIPGSGFDLMTMFYLHLQTEAHADLLATVGEALAPRGRFLYVGHDEGFIATHHGRMGELIHENDEDAIRHEDHGHHDEDEDIWADREVGGPDRIAPMLTGLTIDRAETVRRRILHGPQEIEATDVVVVARKD